MYTVSRMQIMVQISPPRLGGGMFVNFLVLNHVCQLCQGMAKYAISFDNLYQKYITRGYVCEFWGPRKVDKHTFLENLFFNIFFCTSVLASPDLSGQLLSYNCALWTAKNQAHATALTDNATNLLQRPKTSKYLFENFQKSKNSKMANLGGLFI